MHYVYVLKSKKDHWYYVGSSTDLQNRLSDHRNGMVQSTASKLPIELVYYEAYKSVDHARDREKKIKASRYEKEKIIDRLKNK